MAVALQALGPLSLPPSYPASRRPDSVLLTPPSLPSLHQDLTSLLWTGPHNTSLSIFPAAAPAAVRPLTLLLNKHASATRASRHTEYIRLALRRPPDAPVAAALTAFHSTLHAAWRLPCSNDLKVPLWRLAINGIPGCLIRPWTCPCGTCTPSTPARQHAFHECPVAAAVLDQLASGLGEPPSQSSVWLLIPPSQAPCHQAWSIVGLAALAAMEHGRRLLWATSHGTSWPLPTSAAGVLEAAVASIGRAAAAHFWQLLHDFADDCPEPPPHWSPLPNLHPFLATHNGRIVVRLPGGSP